MYIWTFFFISILSTGNSKFLSLNLTRKTISYSLFYRIIIKNKIIDINVYSYGESWYDIVLLIAQIYTI